MQVAELFFSKNYKICEFLSLQRPALMRSSTRTISPTTIDTAPRVEITENNTQKIGVEGILVVGVRHFRSLYNSFLNSRRFISQLTDFFFSILLETFSPLAISLSSRIIVVVHFVFIIRRFFGFCAVHIQSCDMMDLCFHSFHPFSRSFLHNEHHTKADRWMTMMFRWWRRRRKIEDCTMSAIFESCDDFEIKFLERLKLNRWNTKNCFEI